MMPDSAASGPKPTAPGTIGPRDRTALTGPAAPRSNGLRSIEIEVRSESGLHARPAAAFVRAAAAYASTIRLENITAARPAVDAKSITAVMTAGVEKGHVVRIEADGPDEDIAVEDLSRLLAGLGEPVGE